MDRAGFNSTCSRSFVKGKSAFPAPPVTVREGSIVPGNKGRKFSIKHHQSGKQQRREVMWPQYFGIIKYMRQNKKKVTIRLSFAS